MPLAYNFDPGQVLMGPAGPANTSPYMRTSQNNSVSMNGQPAQTSVSSGSSLLAPETVRASGSGPYDQAYRQNLATYAGGQFSRPGGSLTFDPTGNLFGNPNGGGNAPVLGTGTGLLDQALGGQPFSYTPPAPQGPSPDAASPMTGWQDWINQFRQNGRGFALDLTQ